METGTFFILYTNRRSVPFFYLLIFLPRREVTNESPDFLAKHLQMSVIRLAVISKGLAYPSDSWIRGELEKTK